MRITVSGGRRAGFHVHLLKSYALQLYLIRGGLVGHSIEMDCWWRRRFVYVSVGIRYDGRPWLRWGRS
jgi:hypothetical protein